MGMSNAGLLVLNEAAIPLAISHAIIGLDLHLEVDSWKSEGCLEMQPA